LVGLVPLEAMLEAGRFYLKKQQRSTGIPEKEIIKIAVKSLGLDDLKPFNPSEKIIEYILADQVEHPLIDMDLASFADETASESPAPGGGSISAYMGAMGAALGTMVANLSSHKRGWDDRWEEFSNWADKGMYYVKELTRMVDEDTRSFNLVMEAFALPKTNDDEKRVRKEAIQSATRYATIVPFRVMNLALESMEVIEMMARIGNPNSVSDAGVGAMAARSAVLGAALNVKINARDLEDRIFAEDILKQARDLELLAIDKETRILEIVKAKI
jgi:glutamate formiminotransferase/formiminotetrahydrofolate cyclodeaminase